MARLQHDKRWQVQQWVHYRKFSPAWAPLADPGPAKGSGSVTCAHGWLARGTDLCEKYTCTEQTFLLTCEKPSWKLFLLQIRILKYTIAQNCTYKKKKKLRFLENIEIKLNLFHALKFYSLSFCATGYNFERGDTISFSLR